MPTAELFIIAASAFAAGLALGPIIGQPLRRLIGAVGLMAALGAAALTWPTGRSILVDTLAHDMLGLNLFSPYPVVAGLSAIAAVLLPLWFGAALTGP
jgi:hypothetical protein